MSNVVEGRSPHYSEQLSGYIDGVLSQGDAQRVRLHLEECQQCRTIVSEMIENRQAAISTGFAPAPDDQWDETPRGFVSRWARNLGWSVLLIWLLVTLALAIWMPENLGERMLTRLLVGGSLVALGALFLSALLDRLRTLKGDIYHRGVRK